MTNSCKTYHRSDDNEAVWKPDIYVGNAKTKSIKKDDGRAVKCSALEFNNYICMPATDVEVLFNHCLRMKK